MASAPNYTYDPLKVVVAVGGNIIEGFARGESIGADYDEDHWAYTPGWGYGARTFNNNRQGMITLSLLHVSPSNAILQSYIAAAFAKNPDTFTALITDNNGAEIVSADVAWVQKAARRGWSNDLPTREWTLKTGNLKFVGGGGAEALAAS